MRPTLRKLLSLLLLSLPPLPALAQAELDKLTLFHAPVLLLRNVQLFDGSGAAPQPQRAILIRDGRIERIAADAELQAPAGAVVRDLGGAAVAPGFVLMHEHQFYPVESGSYGAMFRSFPLLYLAGGVTTLRTAGSMSPYADLNARRDIESGAAAGPDMDVTAPYLNGATPFVAQVPRIKNAADAERMVRYWADEGASSYKGYMHLTRAQLAAAVSAAHARQAKMTAHLCAVSYREAADAGIDNLEHGFMVASDFVKDRKPDVCPAGDAVGRSLDALAVDDAGMKALQAHLIAKKVAITSTLTIYETFAQGRPMAPAGALDLLIPQLREQYVSRYTTIQRGAPNLWTRLLPKAMAWEKQFVEAGGLLLAGTDPTGYGGVVPGYSSLRQLELLIEAGFEPAQAIRIMTLNGARYLGREAEIGSLAAGKRADLVVFQQPIVAGQPLPGLAWTMKAGRAFDRDKILAIWKGRVGLQ
ncbi:amidohydrolase family protein [Roseateles violae]|uniref:Amidohydrolase family protein n=1 Tax=Roseateles violae TaxID=3058042 RepID=A0ABT8DYM6_9BURK|nr:amidohydrolase family protein [Pelomonas sp. PFR6]MDN3922682.1 amidohydrolase family protein [Pelomonas sp. PFR6]